MKNSLENKTSLFSNSMKIPDDILNKMSEDFDIKNEIRNNVKLFKASMYEDDSENEASEDETSEEKTVNKDTYIDIDMLRTGKFLRNYYGIFTKVITIDEEMIDKMIKNFNEKIVPEEIQLDTEHRMEESYGWLKSVKKVYKKIKDVTQCFLVGKWKLTKAGKKLIEDEVYKHFSIEFRHNYSNSEIFETTKDPNGNEIPVGPINYFGPTITGGALTNRPFIPNMKAIEANEFFNKNHNIKEQLIEISDEQEFNSSRSEQTMLNSSENNVKNKEHFSLSKNIILALNNANSKPKGNDMDIKKLTTSNSVLALLKDTYSKIEDKTSEEATSLLKKITDFETELSDVQSQNETLSSENAKLSDDIKSTTTRFVQLENQVKSLNSEVLLSKERARQADIEAYCGNMISLKNVTKPTADKIKEFLTADTGAVLFKIENTEFKLKDVVDGIIDSLPKGAFVPARTKLDTNDGLDKSDKGNDRNSFNTENNENDEKAFDEALNAATRKTSSKYNANDSKANVVIKPAADKVSN